MNPLARNLGRMVAATALIGLTIPGCGTAQDMPRDRLEQVAREIIEAANYTALITLDAAGHPRARVMDPFPPEDDMSVWLATNPLSRKVEQIRTDDRVTLYYFDEVGLGYVTLMGTARLVDDPEEKARRWKPGWEAFYADRDSSYLLIEVRPQTMEVISVKHGLDGDPATWTPPGLEMP